MAQSGYNQLVWDENTLTWVTMSQPLVSTERENLNGSES